MQLCLSRGDTSHSMLALSPLQTVPLTSSCEKLELVLLCEGLKVTTVPFGFGIKGNQSKTKQAANNFANVPD